MSVHADLADVFRHRLENNVSYQKALLQYEQARYTVKQQKDVFIPYLGIETGRFQMGTMTGGSSRDAEAPAPFSTGLDFSLQASFLNVLGTNIVISAPLSWESKQGFSPEFPTLTASRSLFEESSIERLEARAQLLKSESQISTIEASEFAALAKDIFNYYYYQQATEVKKEYACNYERLLEATRDRSEARDLKRQWYTVRKGLLESESILGNLTQQDTGFASADVEPLYNELLAVAKSWESELPNPDSLPAEGENIKALRLSLEAAERQQAFWFLPYIPNPSFSGSISYDLEKKALEWSVSIGFELAILDRGERASESLLRKRGEHIAELELQNAIRTSRSSLERDWREKEILWLDYEITSMDREESHESYQDAEELYEGGFISREEFELQELEYRNALLEEKRAYHRYLLQILRLLQTYDMRALPAGLQQTISRGNNQ
jgi:hypothetical protein